jgi:hypothetical protein
MPIILKGVQCWEDALRAYDEGLAGVVLSNHGGRQLDFARSGIEILVEVVEKLGEKRGLKFPNEKFQLFVDGGVRRATDVLKAVALGATAGTLPLGAFRLRAVPDRCLGNSRHWSAVPVRVLYVRPGGRGQGSANSPCMFSLVMIVCLQSAERADLGRV